MTMTEQHCEGVSVAHGKARESQERFPHGLECGAGKDFVDHMQNFPVSAIRTLGSRVSVWWRLSCRLRNLSPGFGLYSLDVSRVSLSYCNGQKVSTNIIPTWELGPEGIWVQSQPRWWVLVTRKRTKESTTQRTEPTVPRESGSDFLETGG